MYIFNIYLIQSMSIANFTITETLEQRVNNAIKFKWYSSKAELYRHAIITFLDNLAKQDDDLLEEENSKLAMIIQWKIKKKYKNKQISSIHDQLADI